MEGPQEIRRVESAEEDYDIHELIAAAKAEALRKEEIEKIKDEADRLTRSFLSGEINLEAFREVDKLENYPGVIEFTPVVAFEGALRALGMDEETITEISTHEQSHHKEIVGMGLVAHYRIELFYKGGGNFAFNPAVRFNFPSDIEEGVAREALRRIISAPSDLSDRDKSQLGQQ